MQTADEFEESKGEIMDERRDIICIFRSLVMTSIITELVPFCLRASCSMAPDAGFPLCIEDHWIGGLLFKKATHYKKEILVHESAYAFYTKYCSSMFCYISYSTYFTIRLIWYSTKCIRQFLLINLWLKIIYVLKC